MSCGEIRNFSTIAKTLQFSTSFMWRNLKFCYICQIYPHLPCIEIWNFSTWLTCELCDKYEVWSWANFYYYLNFCYRNIIIIIYIMIIVIPFLVAKVLVGHVVASQSPEVRPPPARQLSLQWIFSNWIFLTKYLNISQLNIFV